MSSKRKRLGSAGESHDGSKASVEDKYEDQTDDVDNEGIYEVDRVIDIKYENDETGRKMTKYRVRWKGFGPIDDTWEPLENFTDLCLPVVHEFRKKYKKMKAEFAGSSSTTVNILSKEIDQIINKTDVSLKQPDVYYLVRWKGYDLTGNTWEHEVELKHAQDMIDAYNHRKKLNLTHKTKKRNKEANIKEVEMLDPYKLKQKKRLSKYSVRENNSKRSSHKASKHKDSQKERVSKQKNSLSESVREKSSKKNSHKSSKYKDSKKKKVHRSSQENKSSDEKAVPLETDAILGTSYIDKEEVESDVKESIEMEVDTVVDYYLNDLPEYNPEKVKNEIDRQFSAKHQYSKDLLLEAIKEDDYQKVFSYLRNGQIDNQDLDYTQLFLKVARNGQRDMALLLAIRVPNLNCEDKWGDTALCMAARKGDAAFAHSLLVMGIPIQEALGRPMELAEKAGHKQFIMFLNQYAKEIGHDLLVNAA